jgi:hypothetical protein
VRGCFDEGVVVCARERVVVDSPKVASQLVSAGTRPKREHFSCDSLEILG